MWYYYACGSILLGFSGLVGLYRFFRRDGGEDEGAGVDGWVKGGSFRNRVDFTYF